MKTTGEKLNDIFKAAGMTTGIDVLNNSKNILTPGKSKNIPIGPNSNSTKPVSGSNKNTSNFDNVVKTSI